MKSNLKIALSVISLLSMILVSAAAAPAASKVATLDYVVDDTFAAGEIEQTFEEIETIQINNDFEMMQVKDEALKPTVIITSPSKDSDGGSSSQKPSSSSSSSQKPSSSQGSSSQKPSSSSSSQKPSSSAGTSTQKPSSSAGSSSQQQTVEPPASNSAHTNFFNMLPLNVDTPTPAPTVKYLSNTIAPKYSDSTGEVLKFKSGSTTYTLPVKDALKHVVANEMNNAMTLEAIKAQVVATHTYIKYYNDSGSVPSVGYKSNVPSKVEQAVNEVYDIIMTYNGKAIYSPYHACSAGSTHASKEVWGGARAYLVAVDSKYDYLADTVQSKPVYKVNKTISEATVKAEIKDHLGVTPTGDPSTWFKFHEKNNNAYTSGNYVYKITIAGKTTTGKNVRSIFGLRSACFDVKYSNSNFVFTTKGYGHGVGMSQWGAHFYALKQGWNFEKIVCHYYTGVTLAKVA